jgi:hypothetical protein
MGIFLLPISSNVTKRLASQDLLGVPAQATVTTTAVSRYSCSHAKTGGMNEDLKDLVLKLYIETQQTTGLLLNILTKDERLICHHY